MKRMFKYLLISGILMAGASSVAGQSQEKAYATLILNFARGIEWPALSDDKFRIGVLEYDPLVNALNEMIGSMRVHGKQVEVVTISDPSTVSNLNILFIPSFKGKLLAQILRTAGGSPLLIITNGMDMARKGSGINFILVSGKLQYEINSRSLAMRGLKVSANIKGMGIEVEQ